MAAGRIAGAIAFNNLDRTTRAYASDGTLSARAYPQADPRGPPFGGNLTVTATDSGLLVSVSAGFGLATGQGPATAFAGSVSVNRVITLTEAILDSVDVTASGAVTVTASDTTDMWVVGGGIAVSTGAGEATGVGISIAYNQIASTTRAAIRGMRRHTTIHVEGGIGTGGGEDALTVSASNDSTIHAFAISAGVAAGGSGGAAVGATVAINLIADDLITGRKALVEATVADATITVPFGPVAITATDHSRIQSIAGALGLGLQQAGVGIAAAVNVVGTQTSASVDRASITGASVTVSATSIESDGLLGGKIVGAAIGAGLGISEGPGVGGSVAVNVVTSTVSATVASTATIVSTSGDVVVEASDSSSIRILAGGIAFAGVERRGRVLDRGQRHQRDGHLYHRRRQRTSRRLDRRLRRRERGDPDDRPRRIGLRDLRGGRFDRYRRDRSARHGIHRRRRGRRCDRQRPGQGHRHRPHRRDRGRSRRR